MASWVALLRAVNVGGTGKLPMAELRRLCTDAGLEGARTYIQSGNVVLSSELDAAGVRVALETVLAAYAGTHVDVVVRSADEMAVIVAGNPFPDVPGAKVGVALRDQPIDPAVVSTIVANGGEEVVLGARELYIHYPDGMGRSKLTIPRALGPVTVRNMNTLTALAAMAADTAAAERA